MITKTINLFLTIWLLFWQTKLRIIRLQFRYLHTFPMRQCFQKKIWDWFCLAKQNFLFIQTLFSFKYIDIIKSFLFSSLCLMHLLYHVHITRTNYDDDVMPSFFFLCTNQICFRYVQCPLSIYQKSYCLSCTINMPKCKIFYKKYWTQKWN